MPPTGIIFDIKKFAVHDGPGIRTTVFFKGCPLDCWWCHNPEGRNEHPETICVRTSKGSSKTLIEKNEDFGRIVTVAEVMAEIVKDTVFYDQSGGGVTFSGGEPLAQPEFLHTLLAECRKRDIHTAVDTSGYAPSGVFDRIYDNVDLFLYDLKNMDDDAHIKYTGVSNRQILENLTMLARRGNKTFLRIPMIPGVTDTGDNIDAILGFIEKMPAIRNISLLPFNRLAEDKVERFGLDNRLGHTPTQSKEFLKKAAAQFESRGYRVNIGG